MTNFDISNRQPVLPKLSTKEPVVNQEIHYVQAGQGPKTPSPEKPRISPPFGLCPAQEIGQTILTCLEANPLKDKSGKIKPSEEIVKEITKAVEQNKIPENQKVTFMFKSNDKGEHTSLTTDSVKPGTNVALRVYSYPPAEQPKAPKK